MRTHLDLFSGIGGFALACRWNGVRTVGFCEIEPYACAILKKHWPDVPQLGDIRELKKDLVNGVVSLEYNPDLMDLKYDSAPGMYKAGLSIGEVADYFNVSRQSMWKILKRRGVEFRSQLKNGDENHFYRGGSLASKRATHMVERAIQKGILKPAPCEACGHPQSQAHHDDYNKPLEVRWLCQPHHHEWHTKNKAVALSAPLTTMSHAEIIKLTHTKEANEKRWKTRREKGTPAKGIDILTAGVP